MIFSFTNNEKFPEYKIYTTNMIGGEIFEYSKKISDNLKLHGHTELSIEDAVKNNIKINTDFLDNKKVKKYIKKLLSKK